MSAITSSKSILYSPPTQRSTSKNLSICIKETQRESESQRRTTPRKSPRRMRSRSPRRRRNKSSRRRRSRSPRSSRSSRKRRRSRSQRARSTSPTRSNRISRQSDFIECKQPSQRTERDALCTGAIVRVATYMCDRCSRCPCSQRDKLQRIRCASPGAKAKDTIALSNHKMRISSLSRSRSFSR